MLFVLAFWPLIVGILVALAWWLIRGRTAVLPRGILAVLAILAGLLGLIADLLIRLTGIGSLLGRWFPTQAVWDAYLTGRYQAPLIAGILALVLLAVPTASRRAGGTAGLEPRTAWSFVRGRWFIAPAAVLVLVVALTVAAGLASEPDDTGRYLMYTLRVSEGFSVGTSIYGWFASVPALILLSVLVILVLLDLVLIARPTLAADREQDTRVRRLRSLNVVRVSTGALLMHLGLVLGSLARTASVSGTAHTDQGTMNTWTPIAALQPLFTVSAGLAAVAGAAFWASVVLSAFPARARARTAIE